jgi:predicted dehydrogenase
MANPSLGVAVIGAGMVGRAHANAYRQAGTVYGAGLPEIRLVAVADTYEPFAAETARRFGYERAETSWQAVAAAPDVDVVSVAVANALHREVVEGLLAAGKHVLCEKPLAPTVADGEAMVTAAVAAAEASDRVSAIGLTFRRSPAINAVREEVRAGVLGPVQHFTGRYWCDYGADPDAPISWRYRGDPGSGALADIGSHLVDLGEFFCGPVRSVQGTTFLTVTKDRPVPLGVAVGHAGGVAVGDTREAVGNDDVATFTATFAGGATGTFAVSRIVHGHANTLTFEVDCERGGGAFDLDRAAEFRIFDGTPAARANGFRQVLVGPAHPYLAGGLPMDFPSVGHGQNDFFVYQARAFLEQVAGVAGLPPCPSLAEGLHNLRILAAVTASAAAGGAAVTVD